MGLEELKRQLKAERNAHQEELKKAKQQIKKVKQQYNAKEAPKPEAQKPVKPEAQKPVKPEAQKPVVHKVKPEKKHDNQVTQDLRVAELSHEIAEDKHKDEVQHERITKEYKTADAAMSDLSKLADQAAHDAKKADQATPALATSLVEDEDLFDVDSLMSEAEAL